jgi:hypothetical protein
MKRMITFLLLLSLGSCQSEYNQQLDKALLLKSHIESKMECCDENGKMQLKKEYQKVVETIAFHATMSGNSVQFVQDVNLKPLAF